MGKKRSKSGAKKKRQKKYKGPVEQRPTAEEPGGGAMQNMVSGFKRAVGTETKKQKTWLDHMWTVLLILAVGAVLFWRFGRD